MSCMLKIPTLGQRDKFCVNAFGILLHGRWPVSPVVVPLCQYLSQVWDGHVDKEVFHSPNLKTLYFAQYDSQVKDRVTLF